MGYWTGVFLGCFGAMIGAKLASESNRDEMCSGAPIVVEEADTIRTFSCTVELKSKENK